MRTVAAPGKRRSQAYKSAGGTGNLKGQTGKVTPGSSGTCLRHIRRSNPGSGHPTSSQEVWNDHCSLYRHQAPRRYGGRANLMAVTQRLRAEIINTWNQVHNRYPGLSDGAY